MPLWGKKTSEPNLGCEIAKLDNQSYDLSDYFSKTFRFNFFLFENLSCFVRPDQYELLRC